MKKRIWLLADNSAHDERRAKPGIGKERSPHVRLEFSRVVDGEIIPVRSFEYETSEAKTRQSKTFTADAVQKLLHKYPLANGILAADKRFGRNRAVFDVLTKRKIPFVVQIEITSGLLKLLSGLTVETALEAAKWEELARSSPKHAPYFAADLGEASYGGAKMRCIALASGRIIAHRNVVIGVARVKHRASFRQAAQALAWLRWAQPTRRAAKNGSRGGAQVVAERPAQRDLPARPRTNLKAGYQQDLRDLQLSLLSAKAPRGLIRNGGESVSVVELFAGAGGMELGFAMADNSPYDILFSGEVNDAYVGTLAENTKRLTRIKRRDFHHGQIEPTDLRLPESLAKVRKVVDSFGTLDVLVGGPPCQGFSSANRNSGNSINPNNQLLITFLNYVHQLEPRCVVLENVQGIMFTDRPGKQVSDQSAAAYAKTQLEGMGYVVFAKLLDAAWYGVPQHRVRFILIGLHRDLGYNADYFGEWGPFPKPTHGPASMRPFVTVKQAIGDLPAICNGAEEDVLGYREPSATALDNNPFLAEMRRHAEGGLITDHITSKHADYVIERYKLIPEGKNWSAIAHTLTNYADVNRTHSNIYRRLEWQKPSVTIGHFRKSMFVHPGQDRGLSLREACRLQSFPDWFRFEGKALGHKQQQIANAVPPLLAKAVADFLLEL